MFLQHWDDLKKWLFDRQISRKYDFDDVVVSILNYLRQVRGSTLIGGAVKV